MRMQAFRNLSAGNVAVSATAPEYEPRDDELASCITSRQVKISRRSVKSVVLVSNLSVSNDALLKLLFGGFTRSLPVAENPPKAVLV